MDTRTDSAPYDELAAAVVADVAAAAAVPPADLTDAAGVGAYTRRFSRYVSPVPQPLLRHHYLAGRAWTELHLVVLLAAGGERALATPVRPWRRTQRDRAVQQLLFDGIRLPGHLEAAAAAEIAVLLGRRPDGAAVKDPTVRAVLRSGATVARLAMFAHTLTTPPVQEVGDAAL